MKRFAYCAGVAAAIACSFLCASQGRAETTWYVDDDAPADFSTIQAALDGADDGDTIIVRDGYYTGDGNRDIDFKGKAVHLSSENGPGNCTIHAQGSPSSYRRCVIFQTGEGEESILDGFTITGGYAGNGGGIRCDFCSPTIVNNIIRDNEATSSGGGIYCNQSSPVIASNTITGGYARLGGGIRCDSCSPTIVNNMISGNEAYVQGGGIMSYRASPQIIGNILTDNAAISDPGSHWTYGCGAGIFCDGASAPLIMANIIARNVATNNGAGICCENHPTVEIASNTIAHNSAGGKGGAIYCWAESAVTVRNSILWGNQGVNGDEIGLRGSVSGSLNSWLDISYSDIAGGSGGVYVEPGGALNWGDGNIDADPLFADPDNGDLHLKSRFGRWDPSANDGNGAWVCDDVTSPCINAGDPTSDYSEEPMFNGGRVNMGAYANTPEASKGKWILPGDANSDSTVNVFDLILVRNRLKEDPASDDNWRADVNEDGAINVLDLIYVRNRLGTSRP